MPARRADRRGFTVAQLLVVVAIIAVLVAVAVPVFNTQAERAREATDAANIRSAYAEVRTSFITEDRSDGSGWDKVEKHWEKKVNLKQASTGWASEQLKDALDAICTSSSQTGSPVRNGYALVLCQLDGGAHIIYSGNVIDTVTASDFLTKKKLEEMFGGDGSKYNYAVINSNETYAQGGGTKKFEDFAKKYGLDLANYGAITWQMYVKEADKSDKFLDQPAIYWSTVKLEKEMVDDGKETYVPVMGYRDGKYDVWYAKVVKYNSGSANEYLSLSNGFASIKDSGGSASFKDSDYNIAKKKYDMILERFKSNGNLTAADMAEIGLND